MIMLGAYRKIHRNDESHGGKVFRGALYDDRIMRMTLISSLAACFGRFITDKNEKNDFRRYLMDEISTGDTDKNGKIDFCRCLKE